MIAKVGFGISSIFHQIIQNGFCIKKKVGFKPFAVPYYVATVVLLRIVGESENWFEVEVNEDTRETKYISKRDQMWGTTKYEYWIYESSRIGVGGKQPLREKPDGLPIGNEAEVQDAFVIKVDGDWALVEEVRNVGERGKQGWIRWKKDRAILVRCLLNTRNN